MEGLDIEEVGIWRLSLSEKEGFLLNREKYFLRENGNAPGVHGELFALNNTFFPGTELVDNLEL